MSRGVRYLGTVGCAELWHFATKADMLRPFPAAVPGPMAVFRPGLHLVFDEGIIAECPAAMGDDARARATWGVPLGEFCAGRAARVLRGLWRSKGGGL